MKFIIAIFIFLFIFTATPVLAEELAVVTGVITSMGEDHIVVDFGNKYSIVTDEMAAEDPSLEVTQCWVGDAIKKQITFKTILGVGYVDLAQITLNKNYVRKIEIIELFQ